MANTTESSSLRSSVRDDVSEAKRREGRLTINKEFESFDAFIQEYVTNISKSGVFIKSKSPLPVGTKVNLRFTLIMDDIETIEGSARSSESRAIRPVWASSSTSSPTNRSCCSPVSSKRTPRSSAKGASCLPRALGYDSRGDVARSPPVSAPGP